MTNAHSDKGGQKTQRGHEPDAVSVRWMALTGLGLLALIFVVLSGVALAFRALVRDSPLMTVNHKSRQESMIPGVKPNQAYDRQKIEATERAMLRQYAWQDKKHGFLQIPIERAMELMAERKFQVEWPKDEMAESQVPAVKSTEKEPK